MGVKLSPHTPSVLLGYTQSCSLRLAYRGVPGAGLRTRRDYCASARIITLNPQSLWTGLPPARQAPIPALALPDALGTFGRAMHIVIKPPKEFA